MAARGIEVRLVMAEQAARDSDRGSMTIAWSTGWAGARHRAGCRYRPRPDVRVDEPRGLAAHHRHRRGALLVALAAASWHKGEESGHVQKVQRVRLDCDGDVVLLSVEQTAASPAIPAASAVFSVALRTGAGLPPIRC